MKLLPTVGCAKGRLTPTPTPTTTWIPTITAFERSPDEGKAYVARGKARPSFKRAFDAQLAVFTGKPSSRLEGDA